MKRAVWLLICVALFAFAGCNGGDDAVTSGSNVVGGAANKGPFQTGSTVTAYELNSNGTRSTTTATGTVSDNLGTYSITGISWGGLTEVEINGLYLDENTGGISATAGTMSAVVNLPAIGGAVNSSVANPNMASTVAATVLKTTLAVTSAADSTAVDAALKSASQVTAAALGLPIVDGNGAAIDLAKLDVTKTADATLGAANKQLLVISATMLDAAINGNASGGDVTALVNSLATDVAAGSVLGTTSGGAAVNAIIVASGVTVKGNAATITSNMSTAITAAGGTVDSNLDAAAFTAAATKVAETAATVLRGVAIAGNQFTVGNNNPVTYSIATDGTATAGGGSISANDVVIGLTFKDLSHTSGTAAFAATYATTINFSISATATSDSRAISGSISPVTIVTDGNGNASVTVPANAIFTYNGTDSTGLNVSGSATNLAANVIQSNNNVMSVDLNALLTIIQNKIGSQAGLDILGTTGTFDFAFGIGGLNVGLTDGAKITQLLPVGTKVSGRSIHGQIITN